MSTGRDRQNAESADAPIHNGRMFDSIAPRYDALNRLMSFGLDQSWRRRLVAAVPPTIRDRVLDLATGTGDVAMLLAARFPAATVIGLDPSPAMLAIAQAKAQRAGLGERASFALGDAQSLPFPARSFDAVTIAFGIRNVIDRGAGLREMARVTRTGGRVAILELSEPDGFIGASLARIYVHDVLPRLGAFLSSGSAYRYLDQSIARFPGPEAFTRMMEAHGLRVVETQRLTAGVAWLFVGVPSPKGGDDHGDPG